MATIIIGGGLAGLTAANHAADHGERVVVLESRSRLGGRARTDELHGHLFNQGPHALYEAGPALQILRSFGIDPEGGAPDTQGALAVDEDAVGLLPVGAGSLARTRLLGVREKWELANALRRIPSMDPGQWADRTAATWLDESFRTPGARRLVAGIMRVATYCADLDLLAADVAVSQVQLALGGVRYVDGGWQKIVDALASRARQRGVQIITGTAVPSITQTGSRWQIPGLAEADSVIVAVSSPAEAVRLTGAESLAGATGRLVPITAATLDVGLRELPEAGHRFAYGLDRPLYFSVHSPPAQLGTGVTLHVMRYLSGNDRDDGPTVRAELEDFLDRLQPGWRAVREADRFLRRMTVSNALPTAGASLAGRPGVSVPDQPGVYVAGDWVGPVGHLADAALSSAIAAVDAARERRQAAA